MKFELPKRKNVVDNYDELKDTLLPIGLGQVKIIPTMPGASPLLCTIPYKSNFLIEMPFNYDTIKLYSFVENGVFKLRVRGIKYKPIEIIITDEMYDNGIQVSLQKDILY